MQRAAWIRSLEDAQKRNDKRTQLAEVSRFIRTSENLEQLLSGTPTAVTRFFAAQRATLYAIDLKNDQLYSMTKSGQEFREVRVPRSPASIAGFSSLSKVPVNVRDVYDAEELKGINPKLRFDKRWDEAAGFRTRSMMTVPVVHDRRLLGVLQVTNREDGLPFMPRDVANAEEVARLLGAALFALRHSRVRDEKRSRWDGLVKDNVLGFNELKAALIQAREAEVEPARFLVEKVGVSRQSIEDSFSAFYRCPFHRFTGDERIPERLRAQLRAEFLMRICAVPIERKDDNWILVIDDPSDIARTDALRAIENDQNLTIHVGFRDEILACVEHAYGMRGDVGLILQELSEADDIDEGQDLDEDAAPLEHDSAVIKLANQVIVDAYRHGASDIHIEPNGRTSATCIRFRVDGECVLYQKIPYQFRLQLVARLKIMAKLDISERRKPQDGKIRFRMPERQIELRVATIPTVNGNEDVVMRILAASKPIPLDEMGMSERNLTCLKAAASKPYGLILCVGSYGLGENHNLTFSTWAHKHRRDENMDGRRPRGNHPAGAKASSSSAKDWFRFCCSDESVSSR